MGILTPPSSTHGPASEAIPEFEAEKGRGEKPGKLYDPYAGLSGALSRKRGALRLPEEPEYLFIEQAKQKRRSWSENLCYYTGMGYGLGALSGGGYGLMQLASNKPEIAIDSHRVRLNRFLNMTGRTGRSFGNAFGVLGLFFATFESSLSYAVEPYLPVSLGTVGAGFATGALFRSTRGPRAAAIAGSVGALAAATLLVGRQFVSGL